MIEIPTFRYDHRSFSQFTTYARCSEQYRLQKVEKVPEQMTAWAPQGSAFHVGMEEWEKSGRALSEQEVVDLAVADYDKRIAEQRERQPEDSGWLTGGRTKPSDDIARRRDKVAQQVRDYIAYSLEHEHEVRPAELPDGRPAVEVPFDMVVNGVRIKGAIDLVLEWVESGKRTIRDLKTGTKLPNDPLQLSVYGLAWYRLFMEVIEYGDFFMCKNNKPTEPFYLLDYPEAYIGAWLEMMDRAEKQGIYMPNGGDHCRVCTVRQFCTLMGSDKRTYQMPTMKVLNYNEQEANLG